MRRAKSSPAQAPAGARLQNLALPVLWLVVLAVPLAFSITTDENFRLPKLLLAETLTLASLLLLALRLVAVPRIDLAALARRPAVLVAVPIFLAAAASLLGTAHPGHGKSALASLAIGLAALVGWSLGLRAAEAERFLRAMIVPAAVMAIFGLLLFHRIYDPFGFEGAIQGRIRLISLAGGAYDFGAYLVLPALFAQVGLYRAADARRRWAWGAALALLVYALAVTQTVSPLLAFSAATVVLWTLLLEGRRKLVLPAVLALAGAGLALGVAPLRERLDEKLDQLRRGQLNLLLTGRLDGWRAGMWMAQQKPLLGVGHGAYRAEFGHAKIALREARVGFYRKQHQTYFSNAHNDYLEALAEWGLLGAAALLWALAIVVRVAWKLTRGDPDRARPALVWAGLTALALLALVGFPFHLAIVAYPAILFLSWIFASARELAS